MPKHPPPPLRPHFVALSNTIEEIVAARPPPAAVWYDWDAIKADLAIRIEALAEAQQECRDLQEAGSPAFAERHRAFCAIATRAVRLLAPFVVSIQVEVAADGASADVNEATAADRAGADPAAAPG